MLENTKIYELYKRAKKLNELRIWKQTFDSDTKKYLVTLVQKQLTELGVDGKGDVIGYYSYATELITKGRKQQGEHYTLKDTGAFYNSMNAEVTDALIWVIGNGRKGKDNLYQKYGEYITTLNEESIKKVQEIVTEKYIEYIRKVLQIN